MEYQHYTKIPLFIFMVFLVCLTAQEYKIHQHQHQHQQMDKTLKSQTSMLSNDVETFAHSNDKRTHLELAGDGIKGIKIQDTAPGRGGRPGKGKPCKKNKNKGSRCNRNSTTTPPSNEATDSVEQDVEQDVELIPQQ